MRTKDKTLINALNILSMKLSRFVKLSFLAGAMALAGIFGGESKAESSVKIDLAYNITAVTNVRGGAISSATPATVSGILLRPEPSIPSAAYIGAEAYAPVALIQFETLNVVQGGPDGRPLPRVRTGFRLQVSKPQFIERAGEKGLEGGIGLVLLSIGASSSRTGTVVEKLINNSSSTSLPFTWEEVRGAATLRQPYKGAAVRWFAPTLTTADVVVQAISGSTSVKGNPVPGREITTTIRVTVDPILSARLAGLSFDAAVKLVVSDLIGRGFVNLDGGEVGIMSAVPAVR